MPISFVLQLKNVREVKWEGTEEPTGVVVTQVIAGESLCMVLFQIMCTLMA